MTKKRDQTVSDRRRRDSSARGISDDTADAGQEKRLTAPPAAAEVLEDLHALMAALREANGHLVAANLRSQALTEQMHALYEEAKSAVQAKDDFFALISHELRTPLTSILGWSELLQANPDGATIAEAARSIAASAAVQAHLIDDLLDVSRIMTNKFAIAEVKMDLGEVINDGVSEMRPLASAKNLSLRTTLAEQPVIINGDPARLRQVLSNLLGNAIKFTPAGGLIETCLSTDGEFAVMEVSDTGEGIPPQFLPHLFERKAQATERRFAGLGLGLAIVKHIVELHRGSVTAKSKGEGKGATFTIRIPCAR
jgi:signal transduction histidine kinase